MMLLVFGFGLLSCLTANVLSGEICCEKIPLRDLPLRWRCVKEITFICCVRTVSISVINSLESSIRLFIYLLSTVLT